MNDVASALDAVERQEAIQAAERREANQALAEKRARQHQEETEQSHKQQKLLHKCIWDNMRPSDRAELLSVKDKYNRDGRISLKILCDPSKNLMPGAGYAESSVHALVTARRSLALFAKSVHVCSENNLGRIQRFLEGLQQSSEIPEHTKNELVDICNCVEELVSAVDVRVHLSSIDFDNL
jgi:hypothetical protein